MKTQFDTQERNEILRRIRQTEEGKRNPQEDLDKAISTSSSLSKKFRESSSRGNQGFSPQASESYARALREQSICEEVIRQLDKDLKINQEVA